MVRVLVVDDSFFMRKLVTDMLNEDPDIRVAGTAKNGNEALDLIPRLRPDVVTLDLNMENGNGLITLRRLMRDFPTPTIILSAYSKKDAGITVQCLQAGALGYVLKPSGELSLDINRVKQELLEKVKAAAKVDPADMKALACREPVNKSAGRRGDPRLAVIGASTGGPQTVQALLSSLPPDL